MGFMDSYKHLEKLCSEILNDDNRVSAYIDEMLSTPHAEDYVHNWNEDLKMLKHYRWVRNQISHEPDCSEANMCDPEDEEWINNFYSRIINQTDPLALYHKACLARQKNTFKKQSSSEPIQSKQVPQPIKRKNNHTILKISLYSLIIIIFYLLAKYILFR